MSSLGSFDITQLAKMLEEIDVDNNDKESDNETSMLESSSSSSTFGPAQIAPCTTTTGNVPDKVSKMSNVQDVVDKKVINPNTIWTETEVKEKEILCNNAWHLGEDPRKIPSYDMHYRQSVTTEDIFLGMSNKTPATASCEALIVEILLPNENYHSIQLDLKSQSIELRSPIYIMFLPLPQPVDPKAGNAKWDQTKEKLIITLVLVRELDILNF